MNKVLRLASDYVLYGSYADFSLTDRKDRIAHSSSSWLHHLEISSQLKKLSDNHPHQQNLSDSSSLLQYYN